MQSGAPELDARQRNQRPAGHLCEVVRAVYGAKYPDISKIKCTDCDPKPLIKPLVVGTIAMLEVIAPSTAFRVETRGRVVPCGQSVRNPNGAGGTTVAFNTYD